MTSKTYVGDVGTLIELDTGVDISTATSVKVSAQKPDGETVLWTGMISGTKVQYATMPDDLDQAGRWLLQAVVTLPTGTWRGGVSTLVVYLPFE